MEAMPCNYPEKNGKSKEVLFLLFEDQLDAPNTSGSAVRKDKHGSVTLDSETEWNNFFSVQNDPSANTTNTKKSKPHIYKDSIGMYRYTAQDENKYNGKELLGKIAEKIKEDLSENIGSATVKDIELKESKDKDESHNVYASARIVLMNGGKGINLSNLLNSDICKIYNVRSITLCYPKESKTRALRFRMDGKNTKIYEVANGSYTMDLTWYVEGKECKIKIGVNEQDIVDLLENTSGVTWEELAAHEEIKVGRQNQARFLHEALSHQWRMQKLGPGGF